MCGYFSDPVYSGDTRGGGGGAAHRRYVSKRKAVTPSKGPLRGNGTLKWTKRFV